MSLRIRVSATVAAVALTATIAAAPAGAAPRTNNTVRNLTDAVTPDGVLGHLEALQAVADANGGDRAAGRPGYRASVDYVVAQLQGAGYAPTVQEFPFAYTEENSELIRIAPLPRTFVNGVDFLRNRFDSARPRAPRRERSYRSGSSSTRACRRTPTPAAASRPTSPASRSAASRSCSAAPAASP